jgi:lipopolysaccharide transport system ATP-binding protein
MNDTLITVEGVSKKFCRSLKRSLWYGMQDLGNELRGHRHGGDGELRPDEFWAVKDVSFELKRGECLGLIGRNGAGKTTLLRMLNGLIKPDSGSIEMRGRVGALIALGAGFNPILTGRENIYVNASVIGVSKEEIEEKITEIVEFAEIGDFIDMPVQNYSSGMTVRLGFSIATLLQPDILILDEVLAVGDAAFRYKCYRHMDQLLKNSAVIFVSHDMPNVGRISSSTLLMSKGEMSFLGATLDGIEAYRELNNDPLSSNHQKVVTTYPPIKDLSIIGLPDEQQFNSQFSAEIIIDSEQYIGPCALRFNVTDLSGNYVASCVVNSDEYNIKINRGKNHWRIDFSSLPLKADCYMLRATFTDSTGAIIALWHDGHQIRVTGGHLGIVSNCQLDLCSWNSL